MKDYEEPQCYGQSEPEEDMRRFDDKEKTVPMDIVRGVIRRMIYTKLCCVRAQSHYGFIATAINQFLMIVVALKLYGHSPVKIMAGLFFVYIAVCFLIGHIDFKYGVFRMENKMCNSVNPEVVESLEILRRLERRLK